MTQLLSKFAVRSALFAAVATVAALPAMGQDSQASYVDPNYKAPKTSWGVPDFEGVYLTTTAVPMERPKELGDKAFYTDAEVTANAQARANRGPARVGVHYDNAQFGLSPTVTGTVPNNRTSMITSDDGRMPEMLPAAAKLQADQRADRRDHQYDGPEMRGDAERCIYWGHEGVPMRPVGYNGTLQIVQSPGYVTIRHEMISTARIIPTDNREHVDSKLRSYFGDSVGHWEGDTLVVDTTNFNDHPPLRGADENLHVVERFTRTSPDNITYQYTVTDPTVWEKSWSAEWPMGMTEGPIYEYACQEGNYGMAGVLSGARVTEWEAEHNNNGGQE